MLNIRIRLIDIHQVDALDDAIDFILTSKPLPQGMSVEHLSKIQKQLNIGSDKIIITSEILHYIIEKYTEKEDGVRNLKRCLEIIYTKLNLCRLMKPEDNIFKKDLDVNIKFPITIDNEMIDKLIKQEETNNWHHMYM